MNWNKYICANFCILGVMLSFIHVNLYNSNFIELDFVGVGIHPNNFAVKIHPVEYSYINEGIFIKQSDTILFKIYSIYTLSYLNIMI